MIRIHNKYIIYKGEFGQNSTTPQEGVKGSR